MPTYELARFTVDPADVAQLVDAHPGLVEAVASVSGALRRVTLVRIDERTFVDIAVWDSREEAEAAVERVHEIPACHRFMALIVDDQPIEHCEVVSDVEVDTSAVTRP